MALRRAIVRTALGVACLGAATVLVLGGVGYCLWAAYQGLALTVGAINAALIIGLLMLMLAGIMVWTARRLTR